jgi:hypothetical protein
MQVPLMPQGKRRPWRDADNTSLIALWDEVGSVALIAIMLKRSRSSVQTQASRLTLPPRNEDSQLHRRRWLEGDDDKLEELLVELARADGSIPIQDLALRMGRSVDAVVARIEARHGEESEVMGRLVAPPTPALPAPGVSPSLTKVGNNKDKNANKVRECLKCRRHFVSGGFHNRVCSGCKRLDDWDYD